jgi:hypothetical protein
MGLRAKVFDTEEMAEGVGGMLYLRKLALVARMWSTTPVKANVPMVSTAPCICNVFERETVKNGTCGCKLGLTRLQ